MCCSFFIWVTEPLCFCCLFHLYWNHNNPLINSKFLQWYIFIEFKNIGSLQPWSVWWHVLLQGPILFVCFLSFFLSFLQRVLKSIIPDVIPCSLFFFFLIKFIEPRTENNTVNTRVSSSILDLVPHSLFLLLSSLWLHWFVEVCTGKEKTYFGRWLISTDLECIFRISPLPPSLSLINTWMRRSPTGSNRSITCNC